MKVCAALVLVFLLFLSFGLPARAESNGLTGMLYEHIDATDPIGAFVLAVSPDPKDTSVGLSASPKATGNEIGDALLQFTDPGAAMRTIEAYKRAKGFTGGRVFAGFTYNENGQAQFDCGISRASKGNYEQTREQGEWYGQLGQGSFKNFKRATRDERVRAIARCFAGLSGMPPLKDSPRTIKTLVIDKASYAWIERWFRSKGVIGTSAQYGDALRCLVAQEARRIPDATGDTAVMKLTTSEKYTHEVRHENKAYPILSTTSIETDDVKMVTVGIGVTSLPNARAIAKASSIDSLWGLWPVTAGFEVTGDQFAALFKHAADDVPACLQQAGLFNSGFAIKPATLSHPLNPCGA